MKIEYLHDSFLDFEGKVHYFCVAAVSEILINNEFARHEIFKSVNGFADFVANPVKTLKLGVSICNPEDEYNPNIGNTIALNKALKSVPVIWSLEKGIISSDTVFGVLKQKAAHIKDNPGMFISGYKEKEQKYKEHMEMVEVQKSMSDSVKQAVAEFVTNPNLLDIVNKLVKWLRQ